MDDAHSDFQLLGALRDFLASRNAAELARAYAALAQASSIPAPPVERFDDVEFAFNRLFVGPRSLPAPPYASVYIEEEPQVMGPSTITVRRIYEMIGAANPWEGHIPDDHISLELDACIRFKFLLSQGGEPEVRDLWNYFVLEHLGHWVPRFVSRVQEQEPVPASIRYVVERLRDWIRKERDEALTFAGSR